MILIYANFIHKYEFLLIIHLIINILSIFLHEMFLIKRTNNYPWKKNWFDFVPYVFYYQGCAYSILSAGYLFEVPSLRGSEATEGGRVWEGGIPRPTVGSFCIFKLEILQFGAYLWSKFELTFSYLLPFHWYVNHVSNSDPLKFLSSDQTGVYLCTAEHLPGSRPRAFYRSSHPGPLCDCYWN